MGNPIFALASGAGRAAVAVMRLSGAGTGALVEALCGPLPEPRRASLRRLRHGEVVLDRALVLWLPAPGSYTGEDSAELQLHGGPAVVAAVAEALVTLGARPAEPGEFTRRAFLHGKLDLTEAEGIADLIAAETEAQRRQALRQAEGGLARRHAEWAARLTRLLARQEAFIEFEEEDLPPDLDTEVAMAAVELRDDMASLLADGARGEKLREGLAIAILGAPNAGKSSLLNALSGRDAAIVSTRAGTTRDVVEVRMALAGVPVTLADTAGLREGADEIEAEGVRRALTRAEVADLRLLVFAADAEPDAATLALRGEDALVIVNKADIACGSPVDGIPVSARTGQGLAELRLKLEAAATARAGLSDAAVLTRPRHRAALRECVEWLDRLSEAGLPELRAEALRNALRALSRLTGRVDVEQVLDLVFGEFCIGK
ncbi:tRNA uridine-5-carboxymethylaminomethyl(34) synthesis GTPase MnmE [Roseococcus sp. SYP-B2431]|uniref:tRNA uridine-5-carboxymethylaminomethyl(34) synthesis GTPase MnmE n=1 Tax=Roseococcus sp. SYP-B2431 TaxID=2496640 RepID=UPI00103A9DEC|nr:tRNA uridine-5-carboxymethylaminomethyl(34) synthesis GTPase MnmE [Roseococcus sp. SYP-B2431]TCH99015.1 tRNA uridine-5-carboxymethylaminomethyl(34) synthesis GTPase MnmE [Roseococcus sp. SYP-B2431]